jgi:hypothetical protein
MASKEDGAKNTARRDLLLELQANAQVSAPRGLRCGASGWLRARPPTWLQGQSNGPVAATLFPFADDRTACPHAPIRSPQAKWEAAKVFEVDAPTDVVSTPDNKFFGNFPYPYMNGKLHLGHAFSLSKLEFAAAFHRMQVRRTQPMQRGGR